jgi:hypothetical protein
MAILQGFQTEKISHLVEDMLALQLSKLPVGYISQKAYEKS